MKTKIEWRHGARVLKLDDTDYDTFPQDGDVIELQEDGETHRFEVKSIDKAVVELELAADDAEVTERTIADTSLTEDQKSARVRKAERLAAEQSAEKQKSRKFKVTPKASAKSGKR